VAGGEIRVGNPLYEGGICKMRITQGELDRLVSGLIEQFRQCTRRTLESAGLNCSDLQAVLLVGGTTRMPAVRQMLKELGAQVNTELDPSTAIAVGAAKYGRMLIDAGVASPSGASLAGTPGRARAELTFEEPLRSVLAHGLGIPVSRGGVDVLHVMVPKDTPLPHETEQTFHTSRAGATSITVTLHEGNREDFADSALLGNCVLTGIPRGRPAGQPVKVRLSIAHNGQKTLEVVDEKTGQRTRMAIEFNEKAVIRADDIDARRHHVMSIALAGQGL
jgi:molecular chaperone DnaK